MGTFDRVAQLKRKVDALKEQAAAAEFALLTAVMEEKASKKWPQYGDTVWFISLGGEVCKNTYAAIVKTSLDNIIALGRGFRTESEACKEYHLQQTIKELRECEGRRPFVAGEDNWGITINLDTDTIYEGKYCKTPAGMFAVYFDTIDNVIKAIRSAGRSHVIEAARWQATKP